MLTILILIVTVKFYIGRQPKEAHDITNLDEGHYENVDYEFFHDQFVSALAEHDQEHAYEDINVRRL